MESTLDVSTGTGPYIKHVVIRTYQICKSAPLPFSQLCPVWRKNQGNWSSRKECDSALGVYSVAVRM